VAAAAGILARAAAAVHRCEARRLRVNLSTLTVLALITVAALAAGCRAQVPGTLVVSDDPELRALAAELLPDLAERSGLELRAPVRLARRSRAELVSYLTAKLEQELPREEARAVTDSYRLLGLVPEGVDLRALLLDVYTEQVAGFYDPDSTALFVMDDQPDESVRTVLIHELVHAVQDQHVDLDSLTARARGNDRQLAAQAAIEGQATLVMLEYMTEQMRGGPVDLTAIPDFAAQVRPALQALRAQYPALASAPLIVQETLLFPYLEGAGWVQGLWHDAGGRPSPLQERLPQSTEQVILRGASPGSGRDEPTEVRLAAPGTIYENSLGRVETGVLLQELAGEQAAAAADGWDGDRFALVEASGARSLLWFSVWDHAAARDRFVAALRPGLVELPAPARLEARDVAGRPGALLTVGAAPAATIELVGGRP
jgi:CheY-like chemotaxis protein